MDAEVREALEGSIKHWEENVAAETVDDARIDMESCALCGLFWLRNGDCSGCPVEAAGHDTCEGSPYEVAVLKLEDWERRPLNLEYRAAWQDAAEAERQFLISLRPEDSQEK